MFKRFLPKSEFSRNVFTLVKGTTIAQAIPMLVAPVLTRIYSPEELGSLAYIISIVSVLAVIATGRYEMAILLPKSDDKARHVLVLSLLITTVFSLFLLLVFFFFQDFFDQWVSHLEVEGVLYWVPPLVLALAVYQGLYYWYNRRKEYRLLSENRVLQNMTNAVLNIGTGLLSFHLIGLLLARFASQLVTIFYLLFKRWIPLQEANKKELQQVGKEYIRFPKFLIFAHTLNSVSLQLPVFLITTFFGASIVGFFSMAQRVIMTPLAIVSNSIGDVFRQEASEQFARTGECKEIYIRTLKKLVRLSFIPFLLFYFLAPVLFTFVFGDDWSATGDYARILTFLFFMQFVARPFTNMFLIAQKQRTDVAWQVLLFLTTALSFWCGHYYFDSILVSLTIFSISRGGCYLLVLFIGYYFASGKAKK